MTIQTFDFSSVSPGDTFKNYKELCAALKAPVKTGGSKIIQLREIQRHCKLTRIEGKKTYIIDEIYNIPSLPEDNRNPYIQLAEKPLINFFQSCTPTNPQKEYYIGMYSLEKLLGFFNESFTKKNFLLESEALASFEEFQIFHFQCRCKSRFKTKVLSILDSYTRQGILSYEFGYKIIDDKDSFHIASPEEEKYISTLKYKAKEFLPVKDIAIMTNLHLNEDYYYDIAYIIGKEKNWKNIFKILKIKILNESWKKQPVSQQDIEAARQRINAMAYESILKEAVAKMNTQTNRIKNLKEHFKDYNFFGQPFNIMRINYYKKIGQYMEDGEKYLKYQENLAEKYLKI